MVIPMIYACIQTEQRCAATSGKHGRVGWYQSDTSGGERKREKKISERKGKRKMRFRGRMEVGWVCEWGEGIWRCQHS